MVCDTTRSEEDFIPAGLPPVLVSGPRNPGRDDEGHEQKEGPGRDQIVRDPHEREQDDEEFPPWRHIPGFERDE